MQRVLLVAPTIDGTDVGEAWVAYQWASRLSVRHDVTVLTYRKRDRPSAVPQLPAARVIEWVEPPLLGRAERLNSLMKPAYVPFSFKARRWIRRALRSGEHFDVGHQPLPVAMRYPSPLAGTGVPYILGPVGGSLSSPPGFADEDTAPWYVRLRELDGLRLRRDPVLRRSYRSASLVLAIAPYARDALSVVPTQRVDIMSETALTTLPYPVDRRPTLAVRLLFVGRLVRTKGARDAIAAMQHLRDLPVELDIVGDGFDRESCESLVSDLRLEDRVRFHGMVPRERVDDFYRAADVFVFPSWREPGGNVAFEAMGFGLPLVVCDRGGPSAAVDESCGFRVPAAGPAQLSRAVADAVRRLVQDAALRAAMGHAARRRVEEIGLWDAKVDMISEYYREVSR